MVSVAVFNVSPLQTAWLKTTNIPRTSLAMVLSYQYYRITYLPKLGLGKPMVCSPTAVVCVTNNSVQLWVSVSLAIYAAAIAISARMSPTNCCLNSVNNVPAVWSILCGKVSHRRALMLLGIVFLAAAGLLLCFMRNITMLVVGRALQGLASSLTWTVGLSIIVDSIDERGFGQAMGWVTLGSSLGFTLSPLLSGVVYGAGGYNAVWFMYLGILALDFTLRVFVIEKAQVEDKEAQPSTSSMVCRSTERMSWAQVRILLTEVRLFIALSLTAVEAFVLTGFDCTLPIFVKTKFNWGPLAAGLMFLPLALPSFLGPVVGHLCDRHGPKWLLTFGFGCMAIFIVALRSVNSDTLSNKVLLCCLLTCIGFGSALVFGPVTVSVMYIVRERLPGSEIRLTALAYAFFNIAFAVGAVAGPLSTGYIQESAGWQTMTLVIAIITCTASAVSATVIGHLPWVKRVWNRMC